MTNTLKKRLMALSMIPIILSTSSCNKNKDTDSKIDENNLFNNINEYTKDIVLDNEITTSYNASNIFFFISKETKEIKKYIYKEEKDYDNYMLFFELYELPSNNLVAYYSSRYQESNNYKLMLDLKDENNILNINDVNNGTKEYYTIDEIEEVEKILKDKLNVKKLIKK